jgi:hypothetical protein
MAKLFMRGGAERYHTAKLETIQQHMVFEQATGQAQKNNNPKNDRLENNGNDWR